MELTLAEFGSFNLRSKSQILSYKAHLIGTHNAGKHELHLYGMSGMYYIRQIVKATGITEKIEPVLNPDMLLLFVHNKDVGTFFMT